MYNLQIIEQRIMLIAKSMNLSKNKLLINAKLNKSVFDNMKKGQIPSVDKIHIIADYLDCSVDYLLGRTDNPEINKSISIPISKYSKQNAPALEIAAYGADGTEGEFVTSPEDIT